tara:strand:- start:1502 stop:2782 length:1281 start_codon:yes stop_codon:yes gene_type:complete
MLPVFSSLAHAAPAADLVDQVPGFAKAPFKVYSGYLTVPGPFVQSPYASLHIHYEFHESQRSPSSDPLVTWHQGGPGGSSLYGQYGEMGYFQVDSNGTHTNPVAWNRVANMLYLESPAGSDDPIGFSYCSKDASGTPALACSWNDTSQAEAYAHTLEAFYDAFPAYSSHPLYLTGESYAGQYVPNIANFIVQQLPSDGSRSVPVGLVEGPTPRAAANLKGFAVGNACWGGSENEVNCNGPNSEQNDIDMYFGKGLVAKPLYEEVYKTCEFPKISIKCDALLAEASAQVGPHNVYDIYDNCPNTNEWLRRSGKTMRYLLKALRAPMSTRGVNTNTAEEGGAAPSKSMQQTRSDLLALSGGYDWSCDGLDAMATFFRRDDVQKAMHLGKPGRSRFEYRSSGPASITLYPSLVKKLRILIYNGDSDRYE